ncbi:MAG: hypothetical protein CVV48_06375 [Spirochaetae bacterium HGW-Spirochaetae-4]|nr:MAG: hypothetical protein CVV48_06375 [Spirochaetae bacterium HGW-Spirochaetae-4]HCS36928.1 hypothetical protein [Sphaerochaeta sp.]
MKIARQLFVTLILVSFATVGLFAAESEMSGNLKLIASTAPEFKVEAGYTVKIPFLQGEGPLFSGNNVKLKGLMGLSPVAATLSVDAVLTPVAVMELSVGGAMGTGWDFPLMDTEGLRVGDGIADSTSASMEGIYYKGRAGVALQFDTAAIWPGEWKSVVMRTYHEVNYQGYSDAPGTGSAWEYETNGLRQNGLNYKGEYLVGYQMPLMVNTVAIMLETYLDNIGTEFEVTPMTFDLGLVANVKFSDRLNLTIIPQLTTRYTDADTRLVTHGDIKFKRVAAMLNYAL